jgi:hypothetical protein
MGRVGHQRLFLGLMGLLLAFGWLVLWLWQHSAYGRYLGSRRQDQCRPGCGRSASMPGAGF